MAGHIQGRLSVNMDEAWPGDVLAEDGTHVICFGHGYDDYGGWGATAPAHQRAWTEAEYASYRQACAANAAELVRRWNAFEEGGAVRLAIEALRRYMTYTEVFGEEELRSEFGPPEHDDSSISMEAWLNRVLRNPARAALAALEGDAGGEKDS